MIEKILETVMLICFAAAWPASIYKSWTSRSRKGKSLLFLGIIITGYICGIAKVLVSDGSKFMLLPYAINTALVVTDLILYYRNYRIDENLGPLFSFGRKEK